MSAVNGKQFRFVVSTAEEAVQVIRTRLGADARVISVRQVEGEGLARFLRAPKLEVIAELAPAAEVEAPNPAEPIVPPAQRAPEGEAKLARLLKAGGIPAPLAARLEAKPEWRALGAMPPGRALARVGPLLREEFTGAAPRSLGSRVAFVGAAGVGKTTALCKQLAGDVFMRGRRGTVLKLDLDRANPADGLVVFCEALGVPCVREPADVAVLAPDQTLYIDTPGVAEIEVSALGDSLDGLNTSGRVLVINAAYDVAIIKRGYDFGRRLGCTHVAFTHLDELPQWGKLWEFLFDGQLTPLFLGTGQNIAGDCEPNVFEAVLARTFPGKEDVA